MSDDAAWMSLAWRHGKRTRRAQAPISMIIVGILGILTGCGQVSSHQSAKVTASTAATATPATATPTAAIAPPDCTADQLQLASVHGGVAAGNVAETFSFTNVSSSACSLRGFPNVQLLDASKRPMSIQVRQQTSSMMFNIAVKTVALAPRAAANFIVEWVDEATAGQTCPNASYVSVAPPNSVQWSEVAAQIAPCGEQITISPVASTT